MPGKFNLKKERENGHFILQRAAVPDKMAA
jgi:hypothetical protein